MGGTSKQDQQTQTSQQSQTQPWAQAIPALNGILSGIQGQVGNYQPNAQEQTALSQISNNAQSLPNFGPQATDLANKYIGGDPSGLLSPALQQYQQTLNPIANASLDPTQTPGMRQLLETIRADVGNSVNGMFAGAGRDLSGLNQQTLARGIAQGEAAPLLAQYNQNVSNVSGAAGNLYNAAGQTASAMGQNQGQGFNFANLIPQMQNAGPIGVLAANAASRSLPLENLGMLANLTVPIAGLGQQSSGSGSANMTGSNTMSGVQQANGWMNLFKGWGK